MPILRALAGAFDRAAAFVACAIVAALLVCVTLGVVTRALGEPLIWTDELSRFLMVWLAVFGWIVASRRRVHVRIRFFQDRLPRRMHQGVEIAIQTAMLLFGALVAAYSVTLIGKNHDLEATTLPVSMAWMYVPMFPAGVITALQGVIELVATLRGQRPAGTADEAVVE